MYLKEDIDNILKTDPAARSSLEVMLCYPGLHAVSIHRFSHKLWQSKVGFLRLWARLISHCSRLFTGIEIHPGATLGRRVFIDHGMGVVVGETAIVGNDVVIYHGVTLGAAAQAREGEKARDVKRHPTLGDSVVVGAGAQIIGDIKVGDNCRVASGSIVLKNVPDNCVVAGIPGRIVYKEGQKVKEEVPDIEAEAIKVLKNHILKLESEVALLISQSQPQTTSSQIAMAQESSPLDDAVTSQDNSMEAVDAFLWGAGI
jgi:serine O-acetyltransferase